MPLEKKLFTQGMNGGSEERFLGEGEYRYALNVRSGSSDNDNIGTIENTKGNTKVELSLPPGINTCIGALEDKNQRKVYYFVYNSSSNHSIAEYNAKTNQAELLFTSSELNFDLDHLITGANIVDDRILKWTDDFSEPKELDVIRIKNRTSNQTIGDNRYPISVSDEQLISAIKYAPLSPPTVEYGIDYSINYNKVYGNLFQFRYQYVYLNNEQSAWSPISKLEIPQGESFIQNKIWKKTKENNSIVLTVNGGSRLVKQINFAVREGNFGNFYIAEELTKQERIQVGNNFDITWRFNNDTVNLPITLAESLKLFDDVPLLAKSQELIDGNRLAYGNIVNGFDQVDTDVNITPVYLGNNLENNLDVTTEVENRLEEFQTFIPQNSFDWESSQSGLLFGFNEPIEEGDVFIIYTELKKYNTFTDSDSFIGSQDPLPTTTGVNYTGPSVQNPATAIPSITPLTPAESIYQASYTASASDTLTNVFNALKSDIEAHYASLTPNDKTFSNIITGTINYPTGGYDTAVRVELFPTPGGVGLLIAANSYYEPENFTQYNTRSGAVTGYNFSGYYAKHIRLDGDVSKTFKVGAKHKFALAYSDRAGRLSTAMRKDNMSVDTDWYNEIPSGDRGVIGMDLEINHQAPAWAEYYHILYSKNTTIGRYLQAVIGVAFYETSTSTWFINIDVSTIGFKESHPNSIVSYDWAKGDRLRVVKSSIDDENSYLGTGISNYVDVEIASGLTEYMDGSTSKEGYPLGAVPGFFDGFESNQTGLVGYVVEVYTPLKVTDEGFYYEIGESYPIVDGNHMGNALDGGQNQTSSAPAIVKLRNEGDVYWRYRWNVLNLDPPGSVLTESTSGGYIEDPSFSDFYISNFTNQGRFNLVSKQARRTRREATIYYSESYIPDTNINGLSSFFLESFAEYNQENGSIQKMYSEDRNVILFQELKVGRVLVNSAVFNDLSGQGLVGQSTTVLSDIQYYPGEYGISKNPESFAVYGGNKYFTDIHRGVVLRLGGDGLSPISEAGMHNYFTDTFNELDRGRLNSVVVGEYDKRFEEYVISIRKEIEFDVRSPIITETTVSFELGGDVFVDTTEDTTEDVDPIDTTGDSGDSGDSTEDAAVDSGESTGTDCAWTVSLLGKDVWLNVLTIVNSSPSFTDALNSITQVGNSMNYSIPNDVERDIVVTVPGCLPNVKLIRFYSSDSKPPPFLDLSFFPNLDIFTFIEQSRTTSILLPNSGGSRILVYGNSDLFSVDFSGFTNLDGALNSGGILKIRQNPNLDSIILPTVPVSPTFSYIQLDANALTSLDLTPVIQSLDYDAGALNNTPYIQIFDNKLNSADIDQIIIDVNSQPLGDGVLLLQNQTPPAPPTATSAAALANLISNGWTVTTD